MYGELSNTLSLFYTFISGVTRGITFRARYRVRNAVGWCTNYSPIGYITAATIPDAPPAPTITYFDQDKISLELNPTLDDGGSAITSYKLYYDDGSGFAEYALYDGSSTT